MDKARWQRLKTAFDALLPLTEAERHAQLHALRGTDPSLAAELTGLLRNAESDSPRIDRAIDDALEALDTAPTASDALVGTALGAYRIGAHIASGGMGAVYRGERDDGEFEQTVAIKLIGSATGLNDADARFRAERDILARLQHPGIAQLLDGGTHQGQAYLVMEFIEGQPIDDYCRARDLNLGARIRLFQQVCDAVHYAHRNLVVHRDIKPSNLLVTAEGNPKLLDFGIAKLLHANRAADDRTQPQFRVLTPRYASPEQINGAPVSTASDVYALGVLLYELLTGQSPYDLTGATPIEQAVCTLDPVRPSRAVAPGVRGQRALKGDLDAIVLKALRKEPEHRYASATELADDLQAFLDRKPVAAQRDTWAYRSQRFLTRHRAPVTLAALSVLTLIALSTFYTLRLADERNRAVTEARKAEQTADFLTRLFRAADPAEARGPDLSARDLLNLGAGRLDTDLAEQPALRSSLAFAISRSYRNMGEAQRALELVEQALETETGAEAATDMRLHRAGLLAELAQYDAADEAYAALAQDYAARRGDWRHQQAVIELRRADIQGQTGDIAAAIARTETALTELRTLGEPARADLAAGLQSYSALRSYEGNRLDEFEPMQEALDIYLSLYGDTHPDVAHVQNNLGRLSYKAGDLAGATRYYQASLATRERLDLMDSIGAARTQANLAVVHTRRGEMTRALDMNRAALTQFKATLGDDHPQVAFLQENLAHNLLGLERFEEALATYRDSARRIGAIFGTDHKEYAITLMNLAGAYSAVNRHQDALDTARQSVELLEAEFGRANVETMKAHAKVGVALLALDEFDAAKAVFTEVVERYRALYPGPNESLTEVLELLGDAHYRLADWPTATRTYENALSDMLATTPALGSPESAESGSAGAVTVEERRRYWLLRGKIGRARLAAGDRTGRADMAHAHQAALSALGAGDAATMELGRWLDPVR